MNTIHENMVLDLDAVVYMRTIQSESERENEGEDFLAVLYHDHYGPLSLFLKSEDFGNDDQPSPKLSALARGLADKYSDRFEQVEVVLEGTDDKDLYLIRRDQVVMAEYDRGSELEEADGRLCILFKDLDGPTYLPVVSTQRRFLQNLTP